MRENLWKFLCVARERLSYCLIWIDALYIDQKSVAERNHQVQRMGRIFSCARLVISWLGTHHQDERLLKCIDERYKRQSWSTWEAYYRNQLLTSHSVMKPKEQIHDFESIMKHLAKAHDFPGIAPLFKTFEHEPYWTRAWVTQELLLARAILVVAGDAAVDFPSVVRASAYASEPGGSHFQEYANSILVQKNYFKQGSPSGRVVLSNSWISDWGLMRLISHFRNKDCAISRDRIYSLLALCEEGKRITVDYNSPECEVAIQILNACGETICFCSLTKLINVLGWKSLPQRSVDGQSQHQLTFSVEGTSSNLATCPSCAKSIPKAWETKEGIHFCLKGSCDTTRGHLFWEHGRKDEVKASQECVYFHLLKKGRSNSHYLCTRGDGVDFAPSQIQSMWALTFTQHALLEIMRGEDC